MPLDANERSSFARRLPKCPPIWAVCWHNFNTTELGSGLIKHEAVGNLYVITWDNVESLPGSTTARPTNSATCGSVGER